MPNSFRADVSKLIHASGGDESMKKALELMLDKLITLEARQAEASRGTHLTVGKA